MADAAAEAAEKIAEEAAVDSAVKAVIEASEDAAIKSAEDATIKAAEDASIDATENAVQDSLEKGITDSLTKSAEESIETSAKKAGEEAAEKTAAEGGDAAAQDAAKKAAEDASEKAAKKSIKDTAKKVVKRLAMSAAALGLTTLEYLHIKNEHSGCKFPIGCTIPTPKPKAYKGSTKAGGIDKTYLRNCQQGGIISFCQNEVKECKSFGGTIAPGSTVAHGVSQSECDKFSGKYKSCDAACVAENTPKTVANQVRGGINKLFGLSGELLEYAYYIGIAIIVCIILSSMYQVWTLIE
jgi:hypothetical protein